MKNNKGIKKYETIVVLVLLLIIAIPTIMLNTVDFSGHNLVIKDNIVQVGAKSFKVEDIKSIKLLEDINIDRRIKGTGTLAYLRGLCKVEGEIQDANVYIYKNKSPYIRIELENGLLIYNDKDSNDTKKTYKNLCKIRNSQ